MRPWRAVATDPWRAVATGLGAPWQPGGGRPSSWLELWKDDAGDAEGQATSMT
jgi:hypothetical protein